MVRHFRQRGMGIEELDPWATGRKSSHPGMPECGERQSLTEKDECTGKIKREPW